MKKVIFILMLVLTGFSGKSQEDSSFLLLRTYEGDIAGAAMDNLDNLYIVNSKGQIRKFNAAGDSVGIYNQLRNFGKLTSIDVSNPLKILLFYRDFSTVVVLDRFLANITTVPLKRFDILQPTAVGLSYDNNILVFDEYDSKLKKIDEQGNRLLETPDLRTAINQSPSPQKIINENGLVYLADTLQGVFVFDNYGTFKRKIPMVNWQSIAVSKNNIISTYNDVITIYNTASLMETKRKHPYFQPYLHSFFTTGRMISFTPQKLQVYQVRL